MLGGRWLKGVQAAKAVHVDDIAVVRAQKQQEPRGEEREARPARGRGKRGHRFIVQLSIKGVLYTLCIVCEGSTASLSSLFPLKLAVYALDEQGAALPGPFPSLPSFASFAYSLRTSQQPLTHLQLQSPPPLSRSYSSLALSLSLSDQLGTFSPLWNHVISTFL